MVLDLLPSPDHAATLSCTSLHSIVRQDANAHGLIVHKYPLLSVFGSEFKEHLQEAKSANLSKRTEKQEGRRVRRGVAVVAVGREDGEVLQT